MDNRYIRMTDIINRDKLNKLGATVIGCGSIGRDVAIKLANIGIPRIQLIDFDKVEDVNLAPQGFYEGDIGHLKTDCTRDLINKINSTVSVDVISKRFHPDMKPLDIVFCCVDSIATRKSIFDRISPSLFIDARMSAENLQVFSVYDPESRKFYDKTLFSASEAHREACTGRSTNYTASIASGIMLAQFTKWMRDVEPEKQVDFNLFSMELSTSI